MNKFFAPIALALAIAAPAMAQPKPDASSAPPPASAAPGADMSDGEVRKIDKSAAKLTLRHGEIKNLDMPSMTMVFRVKDAKLLDKLTPGDKVRFAAEMIDGQLVVTRIAPAK